MSAAASSSSDGSVSLTPLPASTAGSMPDAMYYTSLAWLSRPTGVPLLASETPPTSPLRRGGGPSGGETPEARRARQAAFLAAKNREIEAVRRKTVKQLVEEAEGKEDGREADAGEQPTSDAPATPADPASFRTPTKAATGSASAASTPAADASAMVSPEKRRAKKLSSLQYPIFAVQWVDVPARQGASSTASRAGEDASLGLVLLAGGGGRKGAGIDSGMLVCSVLPADAGVFAQASSPIRMSAVSAAGLALNPLSFLDSNDFLIGALQPHPVEPVIAATVGAGTAILRAEPSASGLEVRYEAARQTDFHKDFNAQAQAWAPSGRWIATGGEDKVIRVWAYPSLDLLGVMTGNELGLAQAEEQHRQPILSLHVNADGTRLASCAGDGHVKVWDTSALSEARSGSEVLQLSLLHNLAVPIKQKGAMLKFQVARFFGRRRAVPSRSSTSALKEDEEDDASESDPASADDDGPEYLVAICSEVKRGGGSSSLVKYSTDDFALVKQVSLGQAPLTTMEISDDVSDPFVALANTDGTVAIYRTDSMRCVKKVLKVHDLPTTALAFSPSNLLLASPSPFASSRWLISASADKSVAIIEVPTAANEEGVGILMALLIALLAIVAAAGGGLVGANPHKWAHFNV